MRIARYLIRKRRTCPKSCTSMYTPVGQNPRFAAIYRTLRIYVRQLMTSEMRIVKMNCKALPCVNFRSAQ